MITSDKQLAVTMKKIEVLQDSLKTPKEAETNPFGKASMLQTQSFIKELESEVEEYKQLQANGITEIKIEDFNDIMLIPIRYRIANHMTQDAFARQVKVSSRMIARYEAEGYRNITSRNLQSILDELDLKLLGKLENCKAS